MQKGWLFRRHPAIYLSVKNTYRWRAPYRVRGSGTLTVLLFPYAFVLEISGPGVEGPVGTITWEGNVTMPDYPAATYTLVQGYDQTLGESPLLKVFLRIDIAAGVFKTWFLSDPAGGWNPGDGEYQYTGLPTPVVGDPIIGNLQMISLRGVIYSEEP